MKLLNLLAVILFFFSFSMRASDNTVINKEEVLGSFLPQPDLKIILKLESEEIQKIRDQREDILKETTGYTPGKSSKRSFCFESPLKNLTNISATLKEVPPSKKSKPNEETEKVFVSIFSKDSAFSSGLWAFVDPMAALSSVGINCDDPSWDSLIDDLVEDEFVNCESQEFFIASTIKYINDNSNALRCHLLCSPQGEMWCRHFATLALPIFAKLLDHEAVPFSGEIHQIAAETLDWNWERAGPGHVWNMLMLKDDDSDEYIYWFVDVFNKKFINLSSSKTLKGLILCSVSGGEITQNPITMRSIFLDYARATRENFNINMGKKKNLKNNKEIHNLAMKKMVINRRVPKNIAVISLQKQNK
jgi:hypothetical protein